MRYFLLLLILFFPLHAFAEDSNCDSIDTEFQMYDCLASHYEETEKNLMATYNQALYQLQDDDEKRKKLFIDSQHNWVSYRETACMSETYDIEDETKQPLMMRLCYMRLAERRTEDIKSNYKTWVKKRKN